MSSRELPDEIPDRGPAGERLVQDLAAAGVRDERVLAAVSAVPRDLFVPDETRHLACQDMPLPIGAGQTISAPHVVALMREVLELSGDERVLDVGTGSGYHAALLSRLSEHVWSIESEPELSRQAQDNLHAAGIENVTLLVGDGTHGHAEAAPYDAINVAAAASGAPPAELEGQLAPGGRLVIPVDGDDQRSWRAEPTATSSAERSIPCGSSPCVRPHSVIEPDVHVEGFRLRDQQGRGTRSRRALEWGRPRRFLGQRASHDAPDTGHYRVRHTRCLRSRPPGVHNDPTAAVGAGAALDGVLGP